MGQQMLRLPQYLFDLLYEFRGVIIVCLIAYLIYWLVEGRRKRPQKEYDVYYQDSQQPVVYYRERHTSDKIWVVTLLLCIFLGPIGAHRFYVGKIWTGILWLFTLGLLGVGVLVDLIVILCGNFRDSYGDKVKTK